MMKETSKRKGGAPKENQNARKHGCYSKVLSEAERLDFRLLSEVDGVDEEITLLRVKLKRLLEQSPENLKLIMRLVNSLGRLVRMKHMIRQDKRESIEEGVRAVLRGTGLPEGLIGESFRKPTGPPRDPAS